MNGNRYYRPELDFLRFLAFLMVFIVHRLDYIPIDPAKHFWLYNLSLLGNFGVPVFFLLSAFLITELLMREQEQAGVIHAGPFYMRRILRIWPLYFAVFYGLVLLGQFLPGAGPRNPSSWFAFSTFWGNWYIFQHGWLPAYPVDPLWSISVEEQFYLVIPLLALFGRRRGLKIVSLLLLVASYVLVTCYAAHRTHSFKQWNNSFVHFQFFAAGILLSIYLKGRLPQWNPLVRIAGVASGIASWFVASVCLGVQADFPHSTAVQAPFGWALILFGTVLLFLSVLGTPEAHIPRALVYLGRISFGLYVFHELINFLVYRIWRQPLACVFKLQPNHYEWFGTVAAFGLTVLVAHLSYRYYESPFLRLKKRFTLVPSRD